MTVGWVRVPVVRWGCEPQVSRAYARQLGVEDEAKSVRLKVRAVRAGMGASEVQFWNFEVVEANEEGREGLGEEWIVVRGKGLRLKEEELQKQSVEGVNGKGEVAQGPAVEETRKGEEEKKKKKKVSWELNEGDRREQDLVTTVQVQCAVSGQWVQCGGVRRGAKSKVSRFVVEQLAANVVGSQVLLKVRAGPEAEAVLEWFEVSEEASPSMVWDGEVVWRRLTPRRPDSEDGARWEAEMSM